MKTKLLTASILLLAMTYFSQPASAQTDGPPPVMSTQPVTLEDKQAMYNATVEERTVKIMQSLAMSDAASSNRVHDAIVAHYHALRLRDEAIDYELGNMTKGSAEWRAQRLAMFPAMTQPLHERFVATLSKDLTPVQLDVVKDKMTYGKVQFTYNAYCLIVPGLTDADKAQILDLLKQAREVAMDGGSSGEKTAVFQQYKDRINSFLKIEGIDVAKAIQDWTDRQKLAGKTTGDAGSNTALPAK